MKFFKASPTSAEGIAAMRAGGKILADVRDALAEMVQPGLPFEDLEAAAQRLLRERGAQPSFTTVEDYKWATCIVKNDGVCHGIPQGKKVADGDVISIDIGALYHNYHTDTTISVIAGQSSPQKERLLQGGRDALAAAIAQAQPGNTVFDISLALESTLEKYGFHGIYQLTGHGVGRKLHLPPNIPCVARPESKRDRLVVNQTIAIEPMYAMGDPTLELADDGWTYRTKDHSLSGMFEHTILITETGPEVLTRGAQDTLLRKT